MSELNEGDEFAGHRIEGIAGRGGMGVVYRARQLDLDRVVALKLIAPALAGDAAFRDRFIGESRAAAAIDHPNVIPVFYAGETDGRLYIAMRFVAGEDLRALVRREGRVAPGRAAHIVSQVAAALDAAHARGLVHRDVKPANVLLGDRDHAYLTDFGLTKRVNSATGATRAGGWVGTLGYVAPEQIRGERTDARSDVYALGCVLYHVLTGSTPFQRDSDEATLWAHLNDAPPSVMSAVPDLPPGFEAVVTRALAKDPDARYQSAGDLGRAALAAAGRPDALEPERVVATGPAAPVRPADETVVTPGEAPTALAPATPPAPASRPRSRRALLGAGAIAALLLAGGAAALIAGGDDGTDAPTTARTTTAASAGRLVDTYAIGPRPNAVVATRRYVWTLAGASATLLSATTGARSARSPKVGAGATAISAGFGRAWIVKGNTRTILAYDLQSARRVGDPIQLATGRPVAIVARSRSVWVGSRGPGGTPTEPATITKIDPATGAITRVTTLQGGLQNMAVGEGGVWVIDGRRDGVRRYDIATGSPSGLIRTGPGAYAIAVGAGGVWVTNQTAGTVTRIDPRTRATSQITVGRAPQGIDTGKDGVWVANGLDGTLSRIDARRREVVGRPVRVGDVRSSPFAVSVHGRSAWTTLLGDASVARVDFAPAAR